MKPVSVFVFAAFLIAIPTRKLLADTPDQEDPMWLRYRLVEDQAYRAGCGKIVTGIDVSGRSSVMDTVRQELRIGLTSLMGDVPGGRAGFEVKARNTPDSPPIFAISFPSGNTT